MSISFIIVTLFVTFALLSLPLLPFYKVWKHLKEERTDLWHEKGPFDVISMMSSRAIQSSFIYLIKNIGDEEDDGTLAKWCHLSREIIKMLPKSFMGQVLYVIIFMFFVGMFTKQILVLLS